MNLNIVIMVGITAGALMRTIEASEFKAKCLEIMEEVAATGEAVLITKNSVPISQLIPARRRPETLLGPLKGSASINGDIVSPVDTSWDALS